MSTKSLTVTQPSAPASTRYPRLQSSTIFRIRPISCPAISIMSCTTSLIQPMRRRRETHSVLQRDMAETFRNLRGSYLNPPSQSEDLIRNRGLSLRKKSIHSNVTQTWGSALKGLWWDTLTPQARPKLGSRRISSPSTNILVPLHNPSDTVSSRICMEKENQIKRLLLDVDLLKSCLMKIDNRRIEKGKGLSLRACWPVGSSELAPILSARKSRPMRRDPFVLKIFDSIS